MEPPAWLSAAPRRPTPTQPGATTTSPATRPSSPSPPSGDTDAESDDADDVEGPESGEAVKRGLFDFLKKKPLTPEQQAAKDAKEQKKAAEKAAQKADEAQFDAFLEETPNSAFRPTFGFGG